MSGTDEPADATIIVHTSPGYAQPPTPKGGPDGVATSDPTPSTPGTDASSSVAGATPDSGAASPPQQPGTEAPADTTLPDVTVTAQRPAQAAENAFSLTTGGHRLFGWEGLRITCGIERFPRDFEIVTSEQFASFANRMPVTPGAPCTIEIGGDTLITGYIDHYGPDAAPNEHGVRIAGHGMCIDLVDCSAGVQPYQINQITLVGLAQKLCQPYGITVKAPDGDSPVIPQFTVTLTEKVFEVLERVARYAQFLLMEDATGALVICSVGDNIAASGFRQGINIEAATTSLTMGERFTKITPLVLSMDVLTNSPGDGAIPQVPYVTGAEATDAGFPARADGKPRYRPLMVVSEQTVLAQGLAAQRAAWDMARRVGRSQAIKITTSGWRDIAGKLWTPNTLVPIHAPAWKVEPPDPWLISEVTYIQDARGTRADLTLMPKEAFIPQKEVLQQYDWQLARDQAGGGAAVPGPKTPP